MLTDAPVIAIVPTTDIARAREFYEGTLGLQPSGVDTPEPQAVFLYRCGDGSMFQVASASNTTMSPTAGSAPR